MSFANWFRGGRFHIPGQTQSAGTVIAALVSPKSGYHTVLTSLNYKSLDTQHTITILKPVAKTFANGAAAAAQKDLILDVNTSGGGAAGLKLDGSEALAGSDYLAWENGSGGYDFDLIASVATSTETVTLTSNIPVAIADGAPVWAFYEVARSTHMKLLPAVADGTLFDLVRSSYLDPISGIADTDNPNEPLLIYSNNATAAGHLENAAGYYCYAGDDNINQVL